MVLERRNTEGFDAPKCESVLSVAHELKAEKFVEIMANRLNTLIQDVPHKIKLAQKYKLDSWLKSLYEEIVFRTNAISIDEAKKIGPSNTVKLCTIRETKVENDTTLYHSHTGYVCPSARLSGLVTRDLEDASQNTSTDSSKIILDLICALSLLLKQYEKPN